MTRAAGNAAPNGTRPSAAFRVRGDEDREVRNLVTLDVCLATGRSVSSAVLGSWAAVIGGGEWMDAERVAGYHGTGFREATGREKEAGRQGPTGKRGAPTTPFPTVPEQRDGSGEIGRSGDSADIGGGGGRGPGRGSPP